ncbi:MAG: mechanosensitive ion channel family protein [Thermoplasmatota archaeon]
MILERVIIGNITIFDLLLSIIILFSVAIIGKIINLNLQRTLKDKVSKDRLNIISKIIYYGILIIAFLIILPILDVNLSGFLVAGGIIAIVIGFASQSIFTNLISGVFLVFERPFKVEDVISLGGDGGTVGMVEDIKIISTTIRTFDGIYVRIPNEKVFTGNITNFLENVARRFEYTVGIRYQDDAEEAIKIIKNLIEDHPLALKNPEPQVFVTNLGSSSVDISVRIWGPSTEWFTIRRELLWKIKETLEENGIKVPFNQQEIWFMNEMKKKEIEK